MSSEIWNPGSSASAAQPADDSENSSAEQHSEPSDPAAKDPRAPYAAEKRRLDTGEQSIQKAMQAGMKEPQGETPNLLDMKITNLAGAVFPISLLINPAKMDINQERLLEQ